MNSTKNINIQAIPVGKIVKANFLYAVLSAVWLTISLVEQQSLQGYTLGVIIGAVIMHSNMTRIPLKLLISALFLSPLFIGISFFTAGDGPAELQWHVIVIFLCAIAWHAVTAEFSCRIFCSTHLLQNKD